MKRIVFLLVAIIALAGCQKDEVKTFEFDSMAKVHIKEYKGLRAEETAQTMTWEEIVRTEWVAITRREADGSAPAAGVYFGQDLRDLDKNELLLPGFLIIDVRSDRKPYIVEGWAMSRDFCIYVETPNGGRDTVAYIPNQDRTAFMNEVRRLFNEGNSEAIYKLFRDSFRARRCTGAEWRALKAKGMN